MLANVAASELDDRIRSKTSVDADFGTVTWNRVSPNGGSVAVGQPFGATGAGLELDGEGALVATRGITCDRQRLRRWRARDRGPA